MTRTRVVAALALALALSIPDEGLAWGADGHRAVGEIAWRLLSPDAKRTLRELLPRGPHETLAEAAAWADTTARSQPRLAWIEPLHFVNADPEREHVGAGRDCGCVVGAIEVYRERVGDATRPVGERVLALRLLAHFVGDVHQPLHVSHRDGRGGTTVDVRLDGQPTHLHAVWDRAILRGALRERGRARGPRWRALARSLADTTSAAERASWTAVMDPNAWADESLALSKSAHFAVRDGAVLDRAYAAAARPLVLQRLRQAGVRLAALLESSF